MPTVNPRLTITLPPEVAAVLKRLSQLTGNSQSAMIGELLESSMPVFERMTKVLEAAEALKGQAMEAPEEVARSLDRAQAKIEEQMGLILDDMGEGFRPLLEEAEKIQRRRSPAAAARTAGGIAVRVTPPSNRGVRSDDTPAKKGEKAKAGRGS